MEKLKEQLSGCKEENKQLQESLHSTSEAFAQVNHQLSLVSDENCSLKGRFFFNEKSKWKFIWSYVLFKTDQTIF